MSTEVIIDGDDNEKNKYNILCKKMKELGYEPHDFHKLKCIGCFPVPESHTKIIWSKKWEHLEDKLPHQTDTCFCNHKGLIYNYYIYEEEKDIIIVVGSDCVLHFGDSPKYKRCDECGEKHSNRKDNYCDDCRIFKKEEDTYPEDIYIHCPYYQKDECKSLGGRYDRDQRSWYIPSGINTSNFTKWIEFKKEEKIYINCPYFQKEECKSLGGRYDRDQRSWYIPPNINSNKFKKWMN
jgi:hypothetical protein